MSKLVNGVFENTEAYARMNYLIDIIRGNFSGNYKFSELDKGTQKMFLKEAESSEYVIELNDMLDLEEYIFNLKENSKCS